MPADSVPAAFFGPQHRGVLGKFGYGDEGKARGKFRCEFTQMPEELVDEFMRGMDAALIPGGHLFLWMDKFRLCTGFSAWLAGTRLAVVDLLTWGKGRTGMGYRTWRQCEHLVVLQKEPRGAKGVWSIRAIPDVWTEVARRNGHARAKPVELQGELISAVSNAGDIVMDPVAVSFSVMEACLPRGQSF